MTAGSSRVVYGPLCLHAVASYPGRMDGICSLVPFHRLRPSRNRGGSAPASTFSRPAQRSLTLRPACSPGRFNDLLHQRLQQSRCLHRCSDCYRVERTSSRAGLTPAVDHHLFTAHAITPFNSTWTGSGWGEMRSSLSLRWESILGGDTVNNLYDEVGGVVGIRHNHGSLSSVRKTDKQAKKSTVVAAVIEGRSRLVCKNS
jgi:hypothetical protein